MNEQASWKGHSFTLLVFGGIVFLCSIFFVLGMLVGRGPGSQHTAESAAVNSAAADTTKLEERSFVSSFDKEPELKERQDPAPVKANTRVPDATAKPLPKPAPSTPAPPKPAKPEKAPVPVPVNMIYLQVAALEKDAAARKQLDDLRKAGFPAVIMSGDGANSLFRVQVGPFSNAADAEISKRKLEALGYKPIKK